MNPCELTSTITALANILSCRLTVDELNILGVILTQLGDTLTTIATHKSFCDSMPSVFDDSKMQKKDAQGNP